MADRAQGGTQHPVTPIVLQVEGTHRRIRSDLRVLEKSDDLGEIGAAVGELPELLKEHFRDEEKPGGLFDEIASLRPVAASQLALRREEHREITRALKDLQRQLGALGELDQGGGRQRLHDDIRVSKARFLQLIHQHERVESRMVADTYYTEDGGSG